MGASAEQIKKMLGNGLSNEVVATAVGVHPSYISQLMSDKTFADDVIALRTQTLTDATSRDRSWDAIEDKLLDKFGTAVDTGMVWKPQDLLRALHVVNNAKRRGNPVQQTIAPNQVIVQLNLPTTIINKFKQNNLGEVVEVTTEDGQTQTLVTMPSSALMQQLTEKHQGNLNYEQVRRYLPQSDKIKDIER